MFPAEAPVVATDATLMSDVRCRPLIVATVAPLQLQLYTEIKLGMKSFNSIYLEVNSPFNSPVTSSN